MKVAEERRRGDAWGMPGGRCGFMVIFSNTTGTNLDSDSGYCDLWRVFDSGQTTSTLCAIVLARPNDAHMKGRMYEEATGRSHDVGLLCCPRTTSP